MRVITTYQCEICEEIYESEEEAKQCENQPVSPDQPDGLIFRWHSGSLIMVKIETCKYKSHRHRRWWRMKSAQGGDYHEQHVQLGQRHAITPEVRQSGWFIEAMKQAVNKGLKPLVWNGTAIEEI